MAEKFTNFVPGGVNSNQWVGPASGSSPTSMGGNPVNFTGRLISGPGTWASGLPSYAQGVGGNSFGLGGPQGSFSGYPGIGSNQTLPSQANSAAASDVGAASEEKAEPANPDTEITENSHGNHKKNEKLKKPQKAQERVKKGNSHQPMKHLGIKSLDKEGSSSGCGDMADPGSLPDDLIPGLGGIARNISTQLPAMEQLLQSLPNNILGNFLGNIPGQLQGFLPAGLTSGLTSGNLFNVNALIGIVGSSAIGNVANDALRSLLPAIGIPQQSIQQLSSLPLQQLAPQLNQIFPQINQISAGLNSFPNGALNAASVAQTLSSVQVAIGSANNSGIPLNSVALNQAVAVALNSSGLANAIPINVMGLSNSFVQNPMGGIIASALGGGSSPIPILGSNLSNPSGLLLSGLSQYIPANIAQNLFNVPQLINMLPGNLQNLIPQIAPIVQGSAPNFVEQIFNASPEKVFGSDIAGGNSGSGACKIKEAPNDGKNVKDTRDINYAQPLSPNFDLWQLVGTGVEGGSHRINESGSGSKPDEVVKNLSSLAINVLEPLKEAYPLLYILSGYREDGDHAKGKSVDVSFPANPTKLMEIADWARQNLPVTVQMNQFKTGWLHLQYSESCSNGGAASTASAGGCEKGLVNRKG